jgi:hypothetical protein
MTVVLELKPEVEKALQKKAKDNGFELNVYLEKLIEKDVDRAKTLDEILAPVRKNFAESGMTEDELDELIESERQAMWEEKHGKRG